MKLKGISATVTVIITIIVLLVVALALMTSSTDLIRKVWKTGDNVVNDKGSKEVICMSIISEELCSNTEGCKWDKDNNKCVSGG